MMISHHEEMCNKEQREKRISSGSLEASLRIKQSRKKGQKVKKLPPYRTKRPPSLLPYTAPPNHLIHVNLPFLEAMIHMPKGAKVLKDLLSHKEKLEKQASLVKLSEECSVVIQRSLPQKEGDPGKKIEPLEWKALENPLKPSITKPPKLELKELPEHLEYALLQGNDQLPIVIYSALSAHKKTKLLVVLKNHKGAIAWSIADIKGIDSSFCAYKILMENEFKPTVQPQTRVNPNIKEVVKKEVIKLLDAGLIYPIFGSSWVSPIQVVSKKGEMTVVKNEKNELIP
ncbi:hypothetical protein Tco_0453459 [Tanacetum coccineum]